MALKSDELERLGDAVAPGSVAQVHFEEVYERFRVRLFRFCYSRLGDAHEAEDVTQETFARAWKSADVLADPDRSYPWLRVVAANLCTDLLRRRGRCQPEAEVDPGVVDAIDDAVIAAGNRRMVRLALGRLNDRHRTALEQREAGGWSYEQMAAHAGTTVGSIESLLWRARQALKRELNAVAGPDGLLAGLPVLGLAIRSWHQGRLRAGPWLTQWVTPSLNAGATMAAAALGSCAAVCAATVLSLFSAPPPAPPAVTPASSVAPSPPGPTPASSGPPAAVPPSSATTPGAATASPLGGGISAQDPVTVSGANNNSDRSMPVNGGIGADTVGVDPAGAVGYAHQAVTFVVQNPLGVRK